MTLRMLWRAWAVVLVAAWVLVAIACHEKPVPVEELYTTRMVALSYLQRNQLPEAESSFRKLTRLAPDDPLGYADLGLTYIQAGRYKEAEDELRKARELDPASTEVRLALARVYSLTGRWNEAHDLLERMRRDSTHNARVLYALADLEKQRTDTAAARAYEDRLRDVLAIFVSTRRRGEDRLRDVLAVAPANLAV